MALSKAEQDQEAKSRDADDAGLAASNRDLVDDAAVPGDEATKSARQPEPEGDTPRPAPVVKNKNDDARNDIVSRFREKRSTDVDEDAAEIQKFVREGMPPELDELEAEEAESADEVAPPVKHKLKVRGKEVELTQEELVAAAQKSLAGEDYLEEGRKVFDDAKKLADEIQATRTGLTGKHPAGEKSATEGETTEAESEHPANPLKKFVEDLQYGADPDQVAQSLDQILDQKAEQKSKQTLASQRVNDEMARSKKVLTDFQNAEENADIAKDPLANAVIERKLYDLQMDDLKALGVDETVMRAQLGRNPGPADVANWHLFYRAEGFSVRPVGDLLKQATTEYKAWKGNGVDDKPSGETGKVEVVIDRTTRRAAIPQQPTRSSAPKRPSGARPTEPDRSSIVQNMIAQRQKPRGSVIVN